MKNRHKSSKNKHHSPRNSSPKNKSRGSSVDYSCNLSELDSHLDKDHLEIEIQRLENKEKEVQSSCCSIKTVLIWLVVIIILFFVLKYWKQHAHKLITLVKSGILQLVGYQYPMNYLLLIAIYTTYLTLCAPGMSVFTIVLAFSLHSFWIPFNMLMIAHFISASLIYFLVNLCCRDFLKRKFKTNMFYLFVVSQSKKNPFAVSFMIRWISIQPAIKNTFVSLGKVPYWIYIVTLYPNSAFHGFVYCYVGIHLSYIDEIFIPKNFKTMSAKKKMSVVLSYMTICITIGIIIFIYCYTVKQMKEFRRRYERKLMRQRKVMLRRLETQKEFELAIKDAEVIVKQSYLETEERGLKKEEEEENQMSTTINKESEEVKSSRSDEKKDLDLKKKGTTEKEKTKKQVTEKEDDGKKEENIKKINMSTEKEPSQPRPNLETIKEERASQEISRYSGSKALALNSNNCESPKARKEELPSSSEEFSSMEKFEGIEPEECRTPVKPTLPSKNLNNLGLVATEKLKRKRVFADDGSSSCFQEDDLI